MFKSNKFLVLGLSLFAMSLGFIFQSCGGSGSGSASNHDGYLISGTVTNVNEGMRIFLDEIDSKKVNVIDTATIAADGSFELKGKISEQILSRLRLEKGRSSVMLILENTTMEVNFDGQDMTTYEVTGSKPSQQLQTLVTDIQSRKAGPDYLKAYTDTVKNPLLAYMAINYLKIENDYKSFQKLASRLKAEMPNSSLTKEFTAYVQSMQGVLKTAVGEIAPDINNLESPDGKVMALSELRGKVVLLDFWASWCRPCRRENPNVVKAYKEYKSKGFEIFSVSLDKNKDKWVKAIKDDNLIWDGHVSDLAGWQSTGAAKYNVKSIPATFLLDKEGKIVAKNLRGKALENKLAELLGEG